MINAKTTLLMISLILTASTADATQKIEVQPIAVVNGQGLSMAELEAAAAGELDKLEHRRSQFETEFKRDRQAALENALDGLLSQRVLAAEAARRRISVAELLDVEVYNAASLPSERQALLETFVRDLKKTYGAMSFLEPIRVAIPTDSRPFKGPVDAPVTIVEFSDFECPYCREMVPTLQAIAADYKSRVRIVYLQFPLADLHRNALKAAEASLCASEQAMFWQLHDAMFRDQANLGVADLKRKAAALSMDSMSFDACLDNGKYFTQVRTDVEEGVKAGVTGTPSLFINGRPLVGNQPYEQIQKIIEDELRRSGM
jgi:protein-disulfide isomerase